jgi:hypothetical protein
MVSALGAFALLGLSSDLKRMILSGAWIKDTFVVHKKSVVMSKSVIVINIDAGKDIFLIPVLLWR